MTTKHLQQHHKDFLALTLIQGLGWRRIAQLLDHFESPRRIWEASFKELNSLPRFPASVAERLVQFRAWSHVDRIFQNARQRGIQWVSLLDASYPKRLSQIHDPPPILWVLGEVSLLSRPMVAVVGTRRAASYSMDLARDWGEKLARLGFVVVSGMAAGVDHAAHQGALEGGKTVAVPGCGPDRIYPVTSQDVHQQMVNGNGAVVSPFLPGSKPERGHFPARNRVISGLSMGVLLVQSGKKGGGMITARAALEQNREVFTFPHDLYRSYTEGGHLLVQSGEAKLITDVKDLVGELPPVERPEGGQRSALDSARMEKRLELTTIEQEILERISSGGSRRDQLSRDFDLLPHQLSKILANLEMEGWLRLLPGGRVAPVSY